MNRVSWFSRWSFPKMEFDVVKQDTSSERRQMLWPKQTPVLVMQWWCNTCSYISWDLGQGPWPMYGTGSHCKRLSDEAKSSKLTSSESVGVCVKKMMRYVLETSARQILNSNSDIAENAEVNSGAMLHFQNCKRLRCGLAGKAWKTSRGPPAVQSFPPCTVICTGVKSRDIFCAYDGQQSVWLGWLTFMSRLCLLTNVWCKR